MARHAPRVRDGGIVLDVAAGSGRHARFFGERGHPVVAVDRNVSGLADLAELPEAQIIQADLEAHGWPFTAERFDGIIVTNYLHRPLLPLLADALSPGGVLIYETFAEGNQRYGRPSNPDFLLREGELKEVYAPLLTVLEYEHGYVEKPKPAVRQGICAIRER